MNELLARAESFCSYGRNYNRNIATAAADLRDAIDRGFPDRIVEAVARVLRLRLENSKGFRPVDPCGGPLQVGCGGSGQTRDDATTGASGLGEGNG